jgi:hypothetical protein
MTLSTDIKREDDKEGCVMMFPWKSIFYEKKSIHDTPYVHLYTYILLRIP